MDSCYPNAVFIWHGSMGAWERGVILLNNGKQDENFLIKHSIPAFALQAQRDVAPPLSGLQLNT